MKKTKKLSAFSIRPTCRTDTGACAVRLTKDIFACAQRLMRTHELRTHELRTHELRA